MTPRAAMDCDTDAMDMNEKCLFHYAHAQALKRNREDIVAKTEEIWRDGVNPLRIRLDKMQWSVIVGMGSLVVSMIFWVLNYFAPVR
jgi:hypothetical protein